VDLRVDLGFAGTPGFGGEALVWRDGAPLSGVNSRHREVPVLPHAKGGEDLVVYIEAAANPRGGGEDMLGVDYDSDDRFVFAQADLAVRNRAVDELYVDLLVMIELVSDLPEGDRRTGELVAALRAACAAVDTAAVAGSADAVRAVLAGPLSRPATSSAHHVSAVGHAHIDSAWLWPVRETVRKCARTFSTALQLVDLYPGYHFACSQAQQHAWMQERYPELFARMREQVTAGRFEPVGSMWVEPDCNIPSGESLVRQFVYGKRFFLDAYGVETVDCWLPDAFGYSGALPQIMAQAGVRVFISQKLSWNDHNRYPHHSFWWEGIDGSKVLAHFPPADTYNGTFDVHELRYSAANFSDHEVSGVSLYPFGYGDGGGGPTEEMLQRAERVADLEGMPRVTTESVRSFVDRVDADGPELATWQGELYLEYHRGTYTTQARTKAANRRSDIALYQAELWSALSGTVDPGVRERLRQAWRSLLLNQFHDILPGSSINWVYKDTEAELAEVQNVAGEIIEQAERSIASSLDTAWATTPIVVFNSASHARRDLVVLSAETASGLGPGAELVDRDGNTTRLQPGPDGTWLAAVEVPSCGWAVYDVGQSKVTGEPASELSADSHRLENAQVRVRLDADGQLLSVYDKLAEREVLAEAERGNVLRLHDDQPYHYDAWDIDQFYTDRTITLSDAVSVELVEHGPLRAGIEIVRRFGSSTLTQVVRLHSGSARIDFDTHVDWHERHKLLKAVFPVAVRSTRATYEIQFGHLERTTHTNTSWDEAHFEVCAQRWADLSEPGYGVALLNDSKYGYRILANTIEVSLLRSPTAPTPKPTKACTTSPTVSCPTKATCATRKSSKPARTSTPRCAPFGPPPAPRADRRQPRCCRSTTPA
jgi:alpha-mannosidase